MWYKDRTAQLRDFTQFGRMLIQSGDLDPQFPVLREIYKQLELDDNTALWFSCLYLTFYHLGSAIEVWQLYPKPDVISKRHWIEHLPYSKQRRCFRGNDGGLRQLNALIKASDGDLLKWLTNLVGDGGEEGWARVREGATEMPYHGPWSSYKFCDMVKFVHGYPITAPDIGTKPGATAGPIAGLASLTGLDRTRCAEDTQLYRDLLLYLQDQGAAVDGLDQMESILCDWQSLINGRYYLSHDVDRDLGQLKNADGDYVSLILSTRKKIFDRRFLGEYGGWSDIRTELNSVYSTRRRLVNNFPDVRTVAMRDK